MAYKTDLQSNNTDLQNILDMILALGLVDVPKTISFTINGISYQADEGMLWAEWVDSDYDVNDEWCLYQNSGESKKYVCPNRGGLGDREAVQDPNNGVVNPYDDVIIANTAYYLGV